MSNRSEKRRKKCVSTCAFVKRKQFFFQIKFSQFFYSCFWFYIFIVIVCFCFSLVLELRKTQNIIYVLDFVINWINYSTFWPFSLSFLWFCTGFQKVCILNPDPWLWTPNSLFAKFISFHLSKKKNFEDEEKKLKSRLPVIIGRQTPKNEEKKSKCSNWIAVFRLYCHSKNTPIVSIHSWLY